jgi:hypothetical protein
MSLNNEYFIDEMFDIAQIYKFFRLITLVKKGATKTNLM